MSEVVSKKLKFKGDKPKKKKRSHKEVESGREGIDDLAVLAAADPRGGFILLHLVEGADGQGGHFLMSCLK
jgi:hypothetical protein